MSKIELKLGRPVIVDSGRRGTYINPHSKIGSHYVLIGGSVVMCHHVEPDLEAPPMNGDEVDGYADKSKKLGHGRYIGFSVSGRHIIETERRGFIYCEHVRHSQPTKREQLMSLVKVYKGGEEILVDEIMQICDVEE